MNKIISNYKDNLNAKKGKQVLGVFSNVVVSFIITTILFVLVFKLAGDNLPVVKEILSEINQKEKTYHDERKNAGLLVYDEENNLLEENYVITKSIMNETKSALIHYHLEDDYKNYTPYKDASIIDEEHLANNPILYYFCSYKVEHKNYYPENTIETNYFIDFYQNKLVKSENFLLYDMGDSSLNIKYFTNENTKLLADYFFKQDTYETAASVERTTRKILKETYESALDDFNINNKHAKELLDDYKAKHSEYANSLIIELCLAYLLATFFTYIVPYLIRKDYDSVGSIFLKTPSVTSQGNKMNIFHELGLFFFNLISNFYILFFVVFIVYGNPGLVLHNAGIFSIGAFSIFSLLFSLISLGFMLIMKDHQYLDAFTFRIVRKNIEETKVIEEEKENGRNE